MGKANKAANRAAKAIALAASNSNMLVGSKATPVTTPAMWAFINAHGGTSNVVVKPLANVVTTPGANPVPFGYNGKVGGVRATIQGWLLGGYQGNHTYAAIMAAAKPLGHSSIKPVCLLALLNGGYSPSSPHYGTPYVALVGKPVAAKQPAKVKATAPVTTAQPAAPAAVASGSTATGSTATSTGSTATGTNG